MSTFTYQNHTLYYNQIGQGKPLLLLHGNTVSSSFFTPLLPLLSQNYQVILLDFLGNGASEHISEWPSDLWYEWSKQAIALCEHLQLKEVFVLGCSGGALVAINLALEKPALVKALIADSFEGIVANPETTEQIRMGREFAKQNKEFCSLLETMHGEDYMDVFNADTLSIIQHAKQVGRFFHKDIQDLEVPLLLMGSAQDEMFPPHHYQNLFDDICAKSKFASYHIFETGNHPSLFSNTEDFIRRCDLFFENI
ncbi:MAG: alpha/beta hydrolase [Bacillota bacterium]|nr:alpha/beta hydrolase [Bacillota bacterium]